MKTSIFRKIFSGYILIALLLTILITFFTFGLLNNFYSSILENRLTELNESLAPVVIELMQDDDKEPLEGYINKIGEKMSTRVTVVLVDGIVIADTEENTANMENHSNRPEIITALQDGTASIARYSETIQKDMFYVASSLIVDGNAIGILRTSLFLQDTSSILNKLKLNIIQSVLVIVLCIIIISAFISQSITKPVKTLTLGLKRFASGDFKTRVFMHKEDEFHMLAENFNAMATQVNELFERVSQQKEALGTIISSMQEGVLVLNNEGKIKIYNESFTNLFHADTCFGKHYWEVINDYKIQEFIKEIASSRKSKTTETAFETRELLLSGTSREEYENTIIVFYDITNMKKFDTLKSELIGNVSHELRTPLTAIKGYLETLHEEVPNKQQQYIAIVSKHTQRLINIVQDLLTLTELEDENTELYKEPLNFRELLERISGLFDQKIRERNLTLVTSIESDLPNFHGDPFKLEQLFINLIDNAVKYTNEGKISIEVKSNQDSIIVSISDTGIGIGHEHLERIFERFYVVNKSRSRDLGGTGLGLAISKHIILLHNGTIKVDSEPNKGTTFSTHLPV